MRGSQDNHRFVQLRHEAAAGPERSLRQARRQRVRDELAWGCGRRGDLPDPQARAGPDAVGEQVPEHEDVVRRRIPPPPPLLMF